MKKLILIPAAAALFLVSCKSKTPSSTSVKAVATSPTATGSKKITAEMLEQGQTIFENSCKKCHDLPEPSKYSDTKWVGIMNAMTPKAKLNASQSELVYDYVTSKN